MPETRATSSGGGGGGARRQAARTQSRQRTQRIKSHGDTETQRYFEQEIKRSGVVSFFNKNLLDIF
jgi:hypothetical protein